MKFSKIWCVILFLALLFRLFGLDLNPVGLSHDDELHDLINAKSLAITGTNVPGVVAGILTQNGHCLAGDCIYGELESYALVPWMRIFPLDIVLSKIPFVLASVGLVWAIGKLFENLSKNTTIGKLAGLLMAINPWAIYYGRTAYSYTFTFLFFVLAGYFFTRYRSYKSNLILGGLSSFWASLFYFGAKPIMPLIVLWGVVYNLYQAKFRHLKFTLLFSLVATAITGGYFWILANSLAGKRFMELGVANISIKERIAAYLGFFSPISLFLTGQKASDNYFMSNQGYFYLIEFLFLILGIIAILASRGKARFVFVLVGIAVIPAAVKTSEASIYSLRSGLAYPLISGIIGWGYYYAAHRISRIEYQYKLAKNFFVSKFFLAIIGILYSLSIAYFLFLYWHRLPIEQGTRWFFHERVLASYITRVRSHSDKNVLVITSRPDGIFNSFVFFGGFYNNEQTIKDVNDSYLSGSFEYNGAKFTNNCNEITKQTLNNTVIFFDQVNKVACGLDQKNTPKIANPKDAGGMFNILNESLCPKYPIKRYPMPKSVYDFKLENLTDEAFCRMWITNPDNYY